jgi:hypothetical protein
MTTDTAWEKQQAKERAERIAKIDERLERFDKIAALAGLGEAEEREPDTYRAFRSYEYKDGASVYFTAGGYEGWDKMSVSGSRPRDEKNQYVQVYDGSMRLSDSSANMSLTKTDEKLAEEVKRRVLTPWEPVLKMVLERIKSDADYQSTTFGTLESLKGGAQLTDHEKESRRVTLWEEDKPRIEITASRRSVSLEIKYIDVDTAQKILKIVRASGVRSVE